jgi:DNA-binding MarR family transcriptional regulator
MRKPIFRNQWYYDKPPQLQIKILKYIASFGELSKKKAAVVLNSNYSVISDAMDALIKRNFIRWSRDDPSTRRAEKFYKITEVGLRALLAVNLSEQEFWKVIILLCISSKRPIEDSEFEEYYHQFENNRLGYSFIHGYFLQSHFFNNIVDQWLLDNNNSKEVKSFSSSSLPLVKISQIVLECLALNRSITLSQLIEKSGLPEQQIKRVLGKYSIQSNNHSSLFDNVTAKSYDDTDIQRQVYSDYIMHTLIVSNGTSVNITYELSLFGVMLVMALVRYYYIGIDTTRCSRLGNPDYIPNLFYKDIDMCEYYDKIAHNYKEKLLRLFGKWDLLKSHLGSSLLYNNFDLFIYEEDSPNHNTNTTIWFGGNKEFYDDLRSLTCDARIKLYIIYVIGKDALENIQKYMNLMKCANILPVHSKITELGQILSYIDIPSFVDGLKRSSTSEDSSLPWTTHSNRIETIEKVFGDELTFLFYLNLNTTGFKSNKADLKMRRQSISDIQQTLAEYKEMLRLGTSPKQRLMTILTKDKDIKEWFSAWIEDLRNYRNLTSKRMSVFYDEVINSHKNIKQKEEIQQVKDKPVSEPVYEEFDIKKICSDIDSTFALTSHDVS